MTRTIDDKATKFIYVIEHTQYGIGMTIQLLPVLLYLKSMGLELYLRTMKSHIEIVKHYIDEDYLYPFKSGYPEKGKWVGDPIWGEASNTPGEVVVRNSSIPDAEGPYSSHATDYYFRKFCADMHGDAIPMELKNFPKFPVDTVDISKFNLPENYVVITPTTTKEGCKIHEDVQLSIVKYLKNKGYNIVYLGAEYPLFLGPEQNLDASRKLTMDKKNIAKDIDLINKTSLSEVIAILDKAKCFIGPEGGMQHMCGMTDTPMIVSYTNMSPKTRMPYRHNELGWKVYPVIPDVECRFCISKTVYRFPPMNLMKNCMFGDFKCVDENTFYKFKQQIDKFL